jgi:hypothetical protein
MENGNELLIPPDAEQDRHGGYSVWVAKVANT